MCKAFSIEISKLKSRTVSLEQKQHLTTAATDDGLYSLNTSINILHQIFNLNTFTDKSRKIQQLNLSLTQQDEETQRLENLQDQILDSLRRSRQSPFTPASSCAAQHPSSPPGYYWVGGSPNIAVPVYCTWSCDGVAGGWPIWT